jgi:hypothetical protein
MSTLQQYTRVYFVESHVVLKYLKPKERAETPKQKKSHLELQFPQTVPVFAHSHTFNRDFIDLHAFKNFG